MRKTVFVIMIALMSVATAAAQPYMNLPALSSIPGIQPGSRIILFLRGDATEGKVWGTDVYTADSSISSAAVHAGALAQGQTGTVTVEVLSGSNVYSGSMRNGVTSQNSGSYPLGFRFTGQAAVSGNSPSVPIQQPVQQFPGQQLPPAIRSSKTYAFTDASVLVRIPENNPGIRLTFLVTGATAGSVWGTGTYTLDSTLAAATVHAGILSPGQKGLVTAILRPGQGSYAGSTRNGVTSAGYGAYSASYTLEESRESGPVTEMLLDTGSVAAYAGARAGQTLVMWITGRKAAGSVWGTDIYTSDSSLAKAAVHAGVLDDGESGPVIVRVLPGQSSYRGSSRNGATTVDYVASPLSYSLERAY